MHACVYIVKKLSTFKVIECVLKLKPSVLHLRQTKSRSGVRAEGRGARSIELVWNQVFFPGGSKFGDKQEISLQQYRVVMPIG